MDTPLSAVLQYFKVISDLENAEEQVIIAASGATLGIQFGTPKADEYQSEPRPCHAALKGFLKALPVSYVFALTALMYTGRDRKNDPAEYWTELKHSFGTKSQAIDALLEKSPRIEYIDRALSTLSADFDLDALPMLIAKA